MRRHGVHGCMHRAEGLQAGAAGGGVGTRIGRAGSTRAPLCTHLSRLQGDLEPKPPRQTVPPVICFRLACRATSVWHRRPTLLHAPLPPPE